MILKKKSESYDTYTLEMSYKEVQAIQQACSECGDPIGDEVARGIDWYFAHNVPPPGMEEHPSKAADKLLPGAGGDEGGAPADGMGGGEMPLGGEGGEGAPLPPEGELGELGGDEGALPVEGAGPGAPSAAPGDAPAQVTTTEEPVTHEADDLLPKA